MKQQHTVLVALFMAGLFMTGCNPTVRVEAPDKPIVINMNIKIDHEIRVKVDKELDSLLTQQGLSKPEEQRDEKNTDNTCAHECHDASGCCHDSICICT